MSEGPSTDVEISPQEIEAELDKILASPLFRRAPGQSRFLEFVVRKTLEGSADLIKEYSIGLEVFDRRSDDYDTGLDPAVRVEAGRLRFRLAEYYKGCGEHDPIQIQLPKGTYVPVFSRNRVVPTTRE
jgi:adenylate cyclase